jgi:Endonuclease/Exonuclease/phosphatase family
MKRIFIFSTLFFAVAFNQFANAQQPQYISAIAGFYNLENLYDTVDNPLISDEEFLPGSEKKYNTSAYRIKLNNMAKVIAGIGTDANPDGLALLGVVEIENDTVLMDLLSNEALIQRGYKFVEYPSPDARGIDVGLIYSPKYFTVSESFARHVSLPDQYATRDILVVKGELIGETVYVLVNHWPSRRGSGASFITDDNYFRTRDFNTPTASNGARINNGPAITGEDMSRPNRMAAAKTCKAIADSIQQINPQAKIIIMGDLNDDPTDISVTDALNAKAEIEKVKEKGIYNPYINILKQGYGTLAYNGKWNLFDQLMFTKPWLDKTQTDGWFFFKAHIYYRDFLIEHEGEYKGYPKRSWAGNVWNEGYSDHLPIYSILVRQMKQ